MSNLPKVTEIVLKAGFDPSTLHLRNLWSVILQQLYWMIKSHLRQSNIVTWIMLTKRNNTYCKYTIPP